MRWWFPLIQIVLVEPETDGNVGAVARVMKNFGFTKLVLVNPKCDYQSDEAKCRAKHANDVLSKAKILKSLKEVKTSTLIATTSKIYRDYNIKRIPITPEQLAGKKTKDFALVFGREGEGLHNTEIENCDLTLTIPGVNPKYPSLNLSHSVACVLYELGKTKNSDVNFRYAGRKEKEVLEKMFNELILKTDLRKPELVKLTVKRLINKSFLRGREANALAGLLKKLTKKIKD